VGTVYYFYNPAESQLFPKCPFLYFTGYQCPGCGSQRAVHAMLHFDFKEAFSHNALLVASVPYVVAGLLFNHEKVRSRFPKTRKVLFGQQAIFVVLATVILFFVVRNF